MRAATLSWGGRHKALATALAASYTETMSFPESIHLPSPLESLSTPDWAGSRTLQIKRDDLIHPIISGNKARKLKTLLEALAEERPRHIVTMGGCYSNFLHALGYVCERLDIPLTAFIRGPEPMEYGATLQDLAYWGTDCRFINRSEFKRLREEPDYATAIAANLNAKWLPEGGSNADAVHGMMNAIHELPTPPDSILVPVGTGCSALGIAAGAQQRGWHTRVIGIVVLKGAENIIGSIRQLATQARLPWPDNLTLDHDYCGKGFGKVTAELCTRQESFETLWNIPLDPVYTVKMCNALQAYCEQNKAELGQHVLLWHTGGLQGNRHSSPGT